MERETAALSPARRGGWGKEMTRIGEGDQSSGKRSPCSHEGLQQRSSGGYSARPLVRTSPSEGMEAGTVRLPGLCSLTFSCARVSFFCTLLAIFPAVTPLLPISAIAPRTSPGVGHRAPSSGHRLRGSGPAPSRALNTRADWRRGSLRP